ncbi:hypothetical protein SAMN04487916_11854 [Arthrobacter sp. ov407]|uniref:hypothetical protein n=1 Tax=Arthrobacter sp. ov407 TaxID=1761748 RepID=UPI0008914E2B|nr:hypothetical protein [Arthrobacter sp. ov407]SDL93153.1 hypothetical protein SAMN04487916_11854 [Arthrobacter sp. ov407]
MEDPTTIALNLTFFGTLGLAFLMFLGLFMVFAATLVLAGIGRLAAVVVLAVAGLLRGNPVIREGAAREAAAGEDAAGDDRTRNAPAKAAKPVRPAAAMKPRRPARNAAKKEPTLSPEWAAAVARADARAAARAKAEAGPAVRVTVRDLPNPTAPAGDIKEVSALVQSAMDTNGTLGVVPRAFKKPPMPAAKSLLDTGSLVSLRGSLPAGKAKPPAQERKAG